MHTPSGRFQPSTRLCLSISDFHPKSFNPAWEVSTILIGLLSFMTSEEMTTGSLSATEVERRWYAARSRWWNSTGGGSASRAVKGNNATLKGIGAVAAGDGGVKFRGEWEELDKENWRWMELNHVDPATGGVIQKEGLPGASPCSPEAAALMKGPKGSTAIGDARRAAQEVGEGWLRRHKMLVGFLVIIAFAMLNRAVKGVVA